MLIRTDEGEGEFIDAEADGTDACIVIFKTAASNGDPLKQGCARVEMPYGFLFQAAAAAISGRLAAPLDVRKEAMASFRGSYLPPTDREFEKEIEASLRWRNMPP